MITIVNHTINTNQVKLVKIDSKKFNEKVIKLGDIGKRFKNW